MADQDDVQPPQPQDEDDDMNEDPVDDGMIDPADILEVIEVEEGEDPADALSRALNSQGLQERMAAEGMRFDDDGDDDDDDAQYAEGEYADEDEEDGDYGMDEGDDGAQELSPTQDDAVGRFRGHTQPVFAVATHNNLVLTGGEDDLGFLWQLDSQKVAAKFDGHTDSVVAVGFNGEGTLAATAAMDGAIRVWKVADGSLACEVNCGDDLTGMAWHPKANFIIAGTTGGAAYMFDIPSGNMTFFGGHQAPVTALAWAPDGRTFVTASEEGSLISWSPKTAQTLVHFDAKTHLFHQAPITAVAYAPDNTLVVSGAQDGTVNLVQIKTGKVLGALAGAEDSIEAIAVSTSEPTLVATGCLDGVVRVYEPFKMQLRFACRHDGGIVSLKWLPAKPFIVSCSLDGTVRLWDGRSGAQMQSFQGHTRQILGFAIAGTTHVVSVSDDCQALVFALPAL